MTTVKLYAGPLHGKTVTLASPGTLHFCLRGWAGRYDKNGCWVGSRKS